MCVCSKERDECGREKVIGNDVRKKNELRREGCFHTCFNLSLLSQSHQLSSLSSLSLPLGPGGCALLHDPEPVHDGGGVGHPRLPAGEGHLPEVERERERRGCVKERERGEGICLSI